MAEPRSFIFIDQMQPQTLCPWPPGCAATPRLDGCQISIGARPRHRTAGRRCPKHADVAGGILVVERQFGYLEFHARSTSSVKAAAASVLEALGTDSGRATRPRVLASEIVTNIDPSHAFLINRNKLGSMVLPGESLFVLEMQPASYAVLAANEGGEVGRYQDRRLPHDGAAAFLLVRPQSDIRSAAAAGERALEAWRARP
jgi:hypothetical protein